MFKFIVGVASMWESKDRINTHNFLDPKIPFLYLKYIYIYIFGGNMKKCSQLSDFQWRVHRCLFY